MNALHSPHWTPAEEALLRARYALDGAAVLARRLPGRTACGVYHRAHRLGLQKNQPWDARAIGRLRALWTGAESLEEIAAKLGRTVAATYHEAQLLGLPLGVPPGYEYLSHAAERHGTTPTRLRHVLAWAGVAIRPVRARPVDGKHPRNRMHYVEPFDVDEAFERYEASESLEAAARRHGVGAATLRRWLLADGITDDRERPKATWRIARAVVDRTVWAHARLVSVHEAALRLRVSRCRLHTALRRAGVPRGTAPTWWIAMETARAALGRRRIA